MNISKFSEILSSERNFSFVKQTDLTNHSYTDEDAEQRHQSILAFTFEVVLMIIVGVIGIMGNIATVWLFCCKGRTTLSKFHKLMIMLSIYDTFYIVLSILLFTIPVISDEQHEMHNNTEEDFSVVVRACIATTEKTLAQ